MVRVHCDPPSGFALSARLRKPSAEDLGNCTLENEFFLKASQEGKEAAEMQKKKPEKTRSQERMKQIRAQGGCQGTIRRRRTRPAAKSYGESQADIDP